MKSKIFKTIYCGAWLLFTMSIPKAQAQQTFVDMEQLTVNELITTVVTASEPILLVDVSTEHVAADRPLNNVLRLKPKEGGHEDGEILAIVTIVTERYRTQYALIYTTHMDEAVSDKEIELMERNAFHNPTIGLSTEDMVHFARRVWQSPAKFRNVSTNRNRMVMRLNNIYAVEDYFFIDFSVENRTNLRFDIDEVRFKLADKKQQKSTNVQIVEVKPSFILDRSESFMHGYRNVVVLKKMTFPNDKVLTIELSEKQISGRTISMTIDYEDVLSADSFNTLLMREE